MVRALHCLLGISLVVMAGGKDLVTTDGKVYKGFTVRKVEGYGVSILYEDGVKSIPFSSLSAEEIAKNGWEADAGVAAQKKAAKEAAAVEAAKPVPWELRPLEERWNVYPSSKGGISISYDDVLERAAFVKKLGAAELWPQTKTDNMVASLGKGGSVSFKIERSVLEAANTKWFTVIVTDDGGKELARFNGENEVPHVPGEDGKWWSLMSVEIDKSFEGKLHLRVVDRVDLQHYDFTIEKRK